MPVGLCIYLPTQAEIWDYFRRHPTLTTTPDETPPSVITATLSPGQVAAPLVDWPSLLRMSAQYDEGTEGTPAGGSTSSYLTYPGAPEVSFEANNTALVRYPYACRKRYKTYLGGFEISTRDTQHPAEIMARVVVSLDNRLSVQRIWTEGNQEGRCAKSISGHLENLDGRVVVEH
jgi:hypothetical protein